MKNLIFLITLIGIFSNHLMGQGINFTFNPKDATNKIDSIRAINITNGKSVFVTGANVISLTSLTTGLNSKEKNKSNFSVFPNPFDNNTELHFFSEKDEFIDVFITNSLGQIVAKREQYIGSGIHCFEISVKTRGLYIINVVSNTLKFSQKIIASANSQNDYRIDYRGKSTNSINEKSGNIGNADAIHFVIYSGDRITKIADIPKESKAYSVDFIECKDNDGKTYPIVQIGEQWWMAENLAYLPEVNNSSSYSTPRYFVYEYKGISKNEAKISSNYLNYGVLYNRSSAKLSCPKGWHLPDVEEWEQLARFIAYNKGYPTPDSRYSKWVKVGKQLKSKGTIEDGDGLWRKSMLFDGNKLVLNIVGEDEFGFSAIPAGKVVRLDAQNIIFMDIEYECYFWTDAYSSSGYDGEIIRIGLDGNLSGGYYGTNKYTDGSGSGLCVRCIKD